MTDITEKVHRYETFLNEKLRTDLRKVHEKRDVIYSELAEFLQLKTAIENIKETNSTNDLKTRVDLGCNFYIQANIPDSSKIFVAVGLDIYLEMTLDEASTFIEKKISKMNEHVSMLSKDLAKIKAHIKLVIEGLREIQSISSETEQEHHNLWS
ncbi:hypothetical protein ScPMuIL_009163 [Solemya velum]